MAQTFAALLLERWDAAAATAGGAEGAGYIRLAIGVRYPVVLAVFAQKKRPVDQQLLRPKLPVTTTTLPPPSAFNFTKIRCDELLCALSFEDVEGDRQPQHVQVHTVDDESHAELPKHAVLINVSPLMRGHSLFVLDLPQVKPQKLERQYLRNGLSIAHAAQDPHFALGFNSVGAWSSVNHFHLQGFFTNEIRSGLVFPILSQPRQELFAHGTHAVVFEFPHWPMHCYGIGVNQTMEVDTADSFSAILEVAWTLITLLQSRNIPHNVLIARDEATSQPLVIVFPRQHQRENGVGLFAEYEGAQLATGTGLRFAIAELAGLVVANNSISYQHFTQETFVQILSNEISLAQVTQVFLTRHGERVRSSD